MSDTRKPEPLEPIEVGSFFLETLTTGMYEDPFHCIREYIQNGYDAIRDAVRAGVVKEGAGGILITIGGTDRSKSMTIRDNGTGVPADKAYSTLVSLGASRKNPNLHAGFRGIGRLAGIAYCGTLRFRTKAKGEIVGTILEYDCGQIRGYLKPGAEPKDVRDVMRAAVTHQTFDEAADEHYTEVEMIALTEVGNEFVDLDRLHPYLSQVCPVAYGDKFDWGDQINALAVGYGEILDIIQVETRLKRERFSIHKPYKNEIAAGKKKATLHEIETFTSKEHGWFGWIGRSDFPGELTDETVAGLRFRVKNIQVGDSRIIMDLAEELTLGGSERRLPRWAVGEIFIANTEIVPNARRDGFEDTPAWRAARADIKETVAKRIIKLIRSTSYGRSALKRGATLAESVAAELVRPSISAEQKNKLDIKLKRQIDKFSSGEFVGPDPKEVSSLISNLKELRERLAKTPTAELPRPSPAPQTPKPDIEAPHSESEDQQPPELDILDVVYEVLAEDLGEEEAERLVDIIAARLGG